MSPNRSNIIGWLIPGATAIAAVAVLLVWQWPNITGQATAASAPVEQAEPIAFNTPEPGASQQDKGLTTSADHVRVTAFRRNDTLRVYLVVDAGWHVNANPASLDFLIPAQLSIRSRGTPVPSTIDYPQGHTVDVGLQQPITVYSGEVRIIAALPDMAPPTPLKAAVRVQACSTKGRCLMPSTIQVPVLADSGT